MGPKIEIRLQYSAATSSRSMVSHDIHVAGCLFSPCLYRRWPCIGYGPTVLSLPQHGHSQQPNEELNIETSRKKNKKKQNKYKNKTNQETVKQQKKTTTAIDDSKQKR
jgi:hypothetical protein